MGKVTIEVKRADGLLKLRADIDSYWVNKLIGRLMTTVEILPEDCAREVALKTRIKDVI